MSWCLLDIARLLFLFGGNGYSASSSSSVLVTMSYSWFLASIWKSTSSSVHHSSFHRSLNWPPIKSLGSLVSSFWSNVRSITHPHRWLWSIMIYCCISSFGDDKNTPPWSIKRSRMFYSWVPSFFKQSLTRNWMNFESQQIYLLYEGSELLLGVSFRINFGQCFEHILKMIRIGTDFESRAFWY